MKYMGGGEGERGGGGKCFKVSGTDYPWKAINLPRDLDDCRGAHTHTHIERSPLLTSSVSLFLISPSERLLSLSLYT